MDDLFDRLCHFAYTNENHHYSLDPIIELLSKNKSGDLNNVQFKELCKATLMFVVAVNKNFLGFPDFVIQTLKVSSGFSHSQFMSIEYCLNSFTPHKGEKNIV